MPKEKYVIRNFSLEFRVIYHTVRSITSKTILCISNDYNLNSLVNCLVALT